MRCRGGRSGCESDRWSSKRSCCSTTSADSFCGSSVDSPLGHNWRQRLPGIDGSSERYGRVDDQIADVKAAFGNTDLSGSGASSRELEHWIRAARSGVAHAESLEGGIVRAWLLKWHQPRPESHRHSAHGTRLQVGQDRQRFFGLVNLGHLYHWSRSRIQLGETSG